MHLDFGSRRARLALVLAVACAVGYGIVGTAQAGRGQRGNAAPGPPPSRVINKVIDLLDEEVFLQLDSDQQVWVSEVFRTSRFTRIGLKVSQPEDAGSIACETAWRFSADDSFISGPPSFAPPPRLRLIGDDDGLPDQTPDDQRDLVTLGPFTIFGLVEVAGLQARIECRPSAGADFGRIVFPGEEQPEPLSGTISDVKVLLRHY